MAHAKLAMLVAAMTLSACGGNEQDATALHGAGAAPAAVTAASPSAGCTTQSWSCRCLVGINGGVSTTIAVSKCGAPMNDGDLAIACGRAHPVEPCNCGEQVTTACVPQ